MSRAQHERWLWCLLAFHVSLAALAALTTRSDGAQAAIFLAASAHTHTRAHAHRNPASPVAACAPACISHRRGARCVVVGGVYASERLNAAAGARWRDFATQNYFDERGVFAAVLWCAPLLLLLAAMLIGFLVRAARLLVRDDVACDDVA
jgi:hypothetical protein